MLAKSNPVSSEAYDNVPYESFAYPNSRPENLFILAKIFGMVAPDFKTARVLELGCAAGGNIFPYALEYKEAHFVGVDLSPTQVNMANDRKNKLGLKNVEFKALSIADIDESLGKFDYIIVHGVYSWVPEDIQDKILQVCNDNLSDNGIAYISYNTLPGWNMVKTIRDMMVYHTARFNEPKDKVKQARLLLNFVKDGLGARKNSYSTFIEDEINLLKNQNDTYLLHDHLEENNRPCYFHEFASRAAAKGLKYLSDISIASMYPGNFPQETANILNTAKDDIIRTEQYMDFIINRRFRSSLLCKANVAINRMINFSRFEDLYFSATVTKKDATPEQLEASPNKTFYTIKGLASAEIVEENKFSKVFIECLINDAQYPIAFKEFVQKVQENLADEKPEAVAQYINANMVHLLLRDALNLRTDKGNFVSSVSDKPKVSELIKVQSQTQDWVTNALYGKVSIDTISKIIIQLTDGTRNLESIKKQFVEVMVSNKMKITYKEKTVNDREGFQEYINEVLVDLLDRFAKNFLFVA